MTARKRPPETVAEAVERRRNCRVGLGCGLLMMHRPTGMHFRSRSAFWDYEEEPRRLFLETGLAVNTIFPADECILLDRWPVSCCRPGRFPKEPAPR